jgi:hypothetical protein
MLWPAYRKDLGRPIENQGDSGGIGVPEISGIPGTCQASKPVRTELQSIRLRIGFDVFEAATHFFAHRRRRKAGASCSPSRIAYIHSRSRLGRTACVPPRWKTPCIKPSLSWRFFWSWAVFGHSSSLLEHTRLLSIQTPCGIHLSVCAVLHRAVLHCAVLHCAVLHPTKSCTP